MDETVKKVIELGHHKLLCGDATKDIPLLVGDTKVDLLLTDPPYGINIVKPQTICGGNEQHVGTVGIGAKADSTGTIGGMGGGAIRPFRNSRSQRRTKHHIHSGTGTVGIPCEDRPRFKGKKQRRPTHTHTPNDDKIIFPRQYKPVINDDKPFNPQHLLDLNVPSIIFGGNNFAHELPNNNKWLVWYKKPSLDASRNHFSDCELAWTNLKGKRIDCYHHTWSGMVRKGNRRLELEERVHPTQKPVGLLMQIIEDYTERGDAVLDPYGGSGSTLIACEQTHRKCLIMELSMDYCNIIKERYNNFIHGRGVIGSGSEYTYTTLENWLI